MEKYKARVHGCCLVHHAYIRSMSTAARLNKRRSLQNYSSASLFWRAGKANDKIISTDDSPLVSRYLELVRDDDSWREMCELRH